MSEGAALVGGWRTGALAGMGEGQVCEELLLEVLHLHLQLQPLLDVLLALAGVEALQALRLSVHDAELGLVALYGLAEEPVLPLQDVVAQLGLAQLRPLLQHLLLQPATHVVHVKREAGYRVAAAQAQKASWTGKAAKEHNIIVCGAYRVSCASCVSVTVFDRAVGAHAVDDHRCQYSRCNRAGPR